MESCTPRMPATWVQRPKRLVSLPAASTSHDEGMHLRRTLAIMSGALLLATACGDDDASDEGGTFGTVAEQPTSEASEADLEVAQSAVLTLNDLPVGWSSKPREADEDDDQFDEQLADCVGVPVEEIAESNDPKAESETFVSEADEEIEAEVVVASTVEQAVAEFDLFTSDAFVGCVREVLPEIMEQAAAEEAGDFTIGDSSIGPLRIEDTGDRSGAMRLTVAIEAEGFSVDAYVDLLFAQVGRATVQLTSTSAFTPVDIGLSQLLLNRMVERVDVEAVA